MRYQISEAQFVGSSNSVEHLPRSPIPEIAVIGRSNVGKSTLINRLVHRKGLAKTSQMPGRTQTLVCFSIRLSGPKPGRDTELSLVDLPGFGYAKVSHGTHKRLRDLIESYLSEREQLCVVCLLNDIRRDPEQEELSIRNAVAESGRHLLVVVTKGDKLPRGQQQRRVALIAQSYGLEPGDVIVTGEELAVEPVWERIAVLLEC